MLGLLREEVASDIGPQPSATDLPRLAETFQAAGLEVRLDMDGGTEGLPAGLDLSVYRIVEEGLTNALKHTPGALVEVHFRRWAGGVEVDLRQLRQQIASAALRGPRPGRHARACRGVRRLVQCHADRGRGFLVRARLPLGEPV